MQSRVLLASNTSLYRISWPPLTRSHSRLSHNLMAFFGACTAGGLTASAERGSRTARGLACALAPAVVNPSTVTTPQVTAASRALFFLVMSIGISAASVRDGREIPFRASGPIGEVDTRI